MTAITCRAARTAADLGTQFLHAGELAGHKLLLTSVRTGDTEIFIVDPDTGDAFNVSRSPQSEDRYPCWSPDGKRIAFTSDRNHSTNLYVIRADGSGLKRIVNSPAVSYMPSWQRTPSGERIVFGMHRDKPEMASVRPDGSDLRMLGLGHDPTLSPDGKTIAYTGEVPGGVTVFLMDCEGGNKRQFVSGASKPGAVFPNWSPDSKSLVYSWPVGEALELFVIHADGTGHRQLTHSGGICTPAGWPPGRLTTNGFPIDSLTRLTGATRIAWPRSIARSLPTNGPSGSFIRTAPART